MFIIFRIKVPYKEAFRQFPIQQKTAQDGFEPMVYLKMITLHISRCKGRLDNKEVGAFLCVFQRIDEN